MKPTLILLLAFSIASSAWPAEVEPSTPAGKEHIYPPSDKPIEIPRDSPIRKELFGILRPGVEKLADERKLKASALQFEGSLRAFNNWALFSGKVLDDRGAEVRFDPDARPENRCQAIFLRTKANGWVLVDFFAGDPGEFNHLLRFERFSVPGQLLPHLHDLTQLSGV